MNCKQQDLPIQRSSVPISDNTAKSEYESKKCNFIVNSKFKGNSTLSELIYNLIIKSEQSKSLHIG